MSARHGQWTSSLVDEMRGVTFISCAPPHADTLSRFSSTARQAGRREVAPPLLLPLGRPPSQSATVVTQCKESKQEVSCKRAFSAQRSSCGTLCFAKGSCTHARALSESGARREVRAGRPRGWVTMRRTDRRSGETDECLGRRHSASILTW